MSGHMLRQLRHLDRRFDDRAGTRDRGAVGRQQGEFGRRDRLQRLGQRRGDREPADEQNEEKRERRKAPPDPAQRSEEHTSELHARMRSAYAVFCLKEKRPSMSNVVVESFANKYRSHNEYRTSKSPTSGQIIYNDLLLPQS